MQTTTAPQKTAINPQLDTKLNRHFLTCSVLAGAAALASTQSADAQIVWSGIQNVPIPSTNGFGGVYIDIDGMDWFIPSAGAGAGEAALPNWDFNPYRASATFGNALRGYWTAGVGSTDPVVDGTFIARLEAGTLIDGNSSFLDNPRPMAEGAGPWNDTDGYLGFRMTIEGNTVYGWLHLDTGSGDAPTGGQGFPAVVTDWAYDASGAGIVAGVVPEPSTVALGCLSAGALGLAAWRKRKKA